MENLGTRNFDMIQAAYRSQYEVGHSCGKFDRQNGQVTEKPSIEFAGFDSDGFPLGFSQGYRDGYTAGATQE